MDILYYDKDIVVCTKDPGVLSTDEPGALPSMLRERLGSDDIRTVHRLDRASGGVMVLARNAAAASELSRQVRDGIFSKEYLACVHGAVAQQGEMRDLLIRDKARKMTFVAVEPGRYTKEALLNYRRVYCDGDMSIVLIKLHTGRTHQIRVQFASRGFPLLGERKYAIQNDDCPLALFSCRIAFTHPTDGREMSFSALPEAVYPWNKLDGDKINSLFGCGFVNDALQNSEMKEEP